MAGIYDKLGRVRKPRVHLSFEVKTGDATAEVELPFVVGVLGDFAGDPDPKRPRKELSERDFVSIGTDNFEEVLKRLSPKLKLQKVANMLQNDGSEIEVDLTIKSMEDFTPAAIANQVPALKRLLDVRDQLRDLLSKADRSEQLEEALEKILSDHGNLAGLSASIDGL